MAQPLKIQATAPLTRSGQVRLGVWIELVTIAWMTIEASVALMVGFMTRSVSLQGFGIDSVIELVAGGMLLWRLLVEQCGGSIEVVEQAERRASWVTATGLFALAVYIVADSAFSLLTQSRPEASWWGVGLAMAAASIMPLLWQSKLAVQPSKRMPHVVSPVRICPSRCWRVCYSTDSLAGGGPIHLLRSFSSTSLFRKDVRRCTRLGLVKRVAVVQTIAVTTRLSWRMAEPTLDLTPELPFRRSTVGEGFAVDENPRREKHSTAHGERLPLRRIQIECCYRQPVLT